jgi:hypothetical protein
MPKVKNYSEEKHKYWTFEGGRRTEFEMDPPTVTQIYARGGGYGPCQRFNRRRVSKKNDKFKLRLIDTHWIIEGGTVKGYFELEIPTTHSLMLKYLSDSNSNKDFVFVPCEKIEEVPAGYRHQVAT